MLAATPQSHLSLSEIWTYPGTASIHAIAATTLFLTHEFYPGNRGFNPGIAQIDWQVAKDGFVALPQGIGLCVEMDERTLDE